MACNCEYQRYEKAKIKSIVILILHEIQAGLTVSFYLLFKLPNVVPS